VQANHVRNLIANSGRIYSIILEQLRSIGYVIYLYRFDIDSSQSQSLKLFGSILDSDMSVIRG
jgi:hypothetical protein